MLVNCKLAIGTGTCFSMFKLDLSMIPIVTRHPTLGRERLSYSYGGRTDYRGPMWKGLAGGFPEAARGLRDIN